jgi:hypothetical protein
MTHLTPEKTAAEHATCANNLLKEMQATVKRLQKLHENTPDALRDNDQEDPPVTSASEDEGLRGPSDH